MTNDLTSPATAADIVHLMRYALIELAAVAFPTPRETDEALIEIANRLHEQAQDQRLNERDRLLVGALARQLIGTEPGS